MIKEIRALTKRWQQSCFNLSLSWSVFVRIDESRLWDEANLFPIKGSSFVCFRYVVTIDGDYDDDDYIQTACLNQHLFPKLLFGIQFCLPWSVYVCVRGGLKNWWKRLYLSKTSPCTPPHSQRDIKITYLSLFLLSDPWTELLSNLRQV